MVWAKLDDAILDNPKIARAGIFGFAMHVAGITWCCRNLSDGKIPYARVTALLTLTHVNVDTANPCGVAGGPRSMGGSEGLDPYIVAEHLVECGLWSTTGDGYEIHDFLEYNPSREKVLSEREKGANRAASHKLRAKKQSGNAVSNAVSNALAAPLPVPDPVSLKQKDLSPKGDVDVVHDYFLEVRKNHRPTSRRVALSPKDRKAAGEALRSGLSVEDLKLACDGLFLSPFHLGQNDRKTAYLDFKYVLRQPETLIQLAEDNPPIEIYRSDRPLTVNFGEAI